MMSLATCDDATNRVGIGRFGGRRRGESIETRSATSSTKLHAAIGRDALPAALSSLGSRWKSSYSDIED